MDCIEGMQKIDDESIDAIITDPPYGLRFMGKEWDSFSDNQALQKWTQEWSSEALRVAKPGAMLFCFGGTRTFHRIACGIEDAGWEIRDTIMWVYGSGFPKSHNIGKTVDKLQGNEREVIGTEKRMNMPSGLVSIGQGERKEIERKITKGNSEWEGWGTTLKPAYEPIVLARKPLSENTIAENVLEHGTGVINIDGCRIPIGDITKDPNYRPNAKNCKRIIDNGVTYMKGAKIKDGSPFLENQDAGFHNTKGRFPANLIHDGSKEATKGMGDKSRYFYCAKASKEERDRGLDGFEEVTRKTSRKNTHPTVKPLVLMEYLVRLTKMPNDEQIYLDPFAGSGTTLIACKQHQRNYIGFELEEKYCEIARARLSKVQLKMF